MNIAELTTIAQLADFLTGSQPVAFSVLGGKDECYRWILGVLVKFGYTTLRRRDKPVVVRYLRKITGYSRQQITRLIRQYRKGGNIKRRQRAVKGFVRKYTAGDIRLLAEMDERHDTPSGPAVKKLCERACEVFGEAGYERLALISVAHLYNLRKSGAYTRQRSSFTKTQPRRSVIIGERRKPQPNGQPDYIRIDTVHQGDLDKIKGVYHINAVDKVTQYEVICAVEAISEISLIPALKYILNAFPFYVLGFHSDNGSEYINKRVAELLEKLRIEFTKSRSRHSNDNALAEGKNGAVIRNLLGYGHIPQHWDPLINEFNQGHLNPYINYHRPCYFPETITDGKGRERKVYRYDNIMTPYGKLKSLPDGGEYLKAGLSFEILATVAHQISDNRAADRLQKARQKLFNTINGQDWKTG